MNALLKLADNKIIVVGAHTKIIQSVLDFDYARGATAPSITAVVGGNRKTHKCWFGEKELLLPTYPTIAAAAAAGVAADWLLNISSANSARKVTEQFFDSYKDASGVHLFCEGLSEQDALSLVSQFGEDKLIAGASGVGLLIPGVLKLGAIGGIFGGNANLLSKKKGNTAVICSSGGMVNEIMDTLLRAGGAPSFAVSFGGDRFPVTSPLQWCLAAEADTETEQILYFGELGGFDEYGIAQAIQAGRIKKPVYVYIAGRYNSGEEKVQFGHAKALAKTPDEGAASKMKMLTDAGAKAAERFSDYVAMIQAMPHKVAVVANARPWMAPEVFRESSAFTAVADRGSGFDPFVCHALSILLEKKVVSDELVIFTEKAYSLLIDHGAEVSGAVNTMITARAGRDMSSALASGILTVGDRFGGAINAAAQTWYGAVKKGTTVEDLLEERKTSGGYVMGIGHRKYSVHNNDPRVAFLIAEGKKVLSTTRHTDYALSVAARTVQKKSNLILNVDGALAAVLLDILIEHEGFTGEQITELFAIEFFNSYFLIPRTVGFIGNFLSQKRRDEGLFRLPQDQIFYE